MSVGGRFIIWVVGGGVREIVVINSKKMIPGGWWVVVLVYAWVAVPNLSHQMSLGVLKRGELVSPCVPCRCRLVIMAPLHDFATNPRGYMPDLGIVKEDGADVG